MKKTLTLVLLLSLALPMHATIMQVTGSFSGAPVSGGSTRLLSGNFKANYDDTLVAPAGSFTFDNLALTDLFLSNPTIGSKTFDLTNTYLDLNFTNGILKSFILGDINNNTVSPGTDDFSAYFENNGAFLLSQVVLAEQSSGFFGVDFRFNDSTAGSFSVAVAPSLSVPDSVSTGLLLALSSLGLLTIRRRVGGKVA